MTETTQLYRHYDSDGILLYIGISYNAFGRFKAHRVSAAWKDLISRIEIENFPSRTDALGAERAAIISEKPIHNIQHNSCRNHIELDSSKNNQEFEIVGYQDSQELEMGGYPYINGADFYGLPFPDDCGEDIPVNWAKMITEMLQRDYTYREIGDYIGMTEGNIRALQSNPVQQPRWAAGESMIALHKRVMRRKIDTEA